MQNVVNNTSNTEGGALANLQPFLPFQQHVVLNGDKSVGHNYKFADEIPFDVDDDDDVPQNATDGPDDIDGGGLHQIDVENTEGVEIVLNEGSAHDGIVVKGIDPKTVNFFETPTGLIVPNPMMEYKRSRDFSKSAENTEGVVSAENLEVEHDGIVIKQFIPSGSILDINEKNELVIQTPFGDTIPVAEVDKNGMFSARMTPNHDGKSLLEHQPILSFDDPEIKSIEEIEAENAKNTEGVKIVENDEDDESDDAADMPVDVPVPIPTVEGYEILMPKDFWEQVKGELADYDLPENAQPTDLVNFLVVNRDKLKLINTLAKETVVEKIEVAEPVTLQESTKSKFNWQKSVTYGLAIVGFLGVCAFIFRKKILAYWLNQD